MRKCLETPFLVMLMSNLIPQSKSLNRAAQMSYMSIVYTSTRLEEERIPLKFRNPASSRAQGCFEGLGPPFCWHGVSHLRDYPL